MADYREISQTYAQGAIKVVILLNSGAALAFVTQSNQLLEVFGKGTIGVSILLWIGGIICGSAAWMVGFYSTRYVDRAEHGRPQEMQIADRLMRNAGLLVVASLALFSSGGVWVAFSLFLGER